MTCEEMYELKTEKLCSLDRFHRGKQMCPFEPSSVAVRYLDNHAYLIPIKLKKKQVQKLKPFEPDATCYGVV